MDTRIPTQIHVIPVRNKTRKRRIRNGQCAAAVRAVTAAKLYRDGQVPSLAAAALGCGACVTYVQAALIVLRSENVTMLERVVHGQIPLCGAARQIKRVAALVNAYRTAGAADRVVFAQTIGPTTLFDSALVPAI